jgi:hypothetical protein
MTTKSIIVRLMSVMAITGLAMTACLPRAVRMGGIVKGVAYGDLNGNGSIETGEGPLDGVTVSLSDCGPGVSQVTGPDGAFNFTNLPEGTCHVSVSKIGWNFSGSFPSLGYPVPVASNPDLPTAFSIFLAPLPGYAPTATFTPTPAGPTDTPTFTLTFTATPVTPTLTLSTPMVSPIDKDINCRFGPGLMFASVGFLKVGQTVPILGTNSDHSWWQIQNLQEVKGSFCWLAGSVAQTSGDISSVLIVKTPKGLVTDVSVDTDAVVHGTCGGPNATTFDGLITVNGPTTVTYHWEIYDNHSNLLNSTSPEVLGFATFGTKHINPGSYSRDCGSYVTKLVVTSPNALTGQASWQIVSP